MAYQRKTADEWHLLVNYGQGWEHETTESSWSDARAQRKCYRDNAPEYPVKVVKHRVRLEVSNA